MADWEVLMLLPLAAWSIFMVVAFVQLIRGR
jgi:hypothetical protein